MYRLRKRALTKPTQQLIEGSRSSQRLLTPASYGFPHLLPTSPCLLYSSPALCLIFSGLPTERRNRRLPLPPHLRFRGQSGHASVEEEKGVQVTMRGVLARSAEVAAAAQGAALNAAEQPRCPAPTFDGPCGVHALGLHHVW